MGRKKKAKAKKKKSVLEKTAIEAADKFMDKNPDTNVSVSLTPALAKKIDNAIERQSKQEFEETKHQIDMTTEQMFDPTWQRLFDFYSLTGSPGWTRMVGDWDDTEQDLRDEAWLPKAEAEDADASTVDTQRKALAKLHAHLKFVDAVIAPIISSLADWNQAQVRSTLFGTERDKLYRMEWNNDKKMLKMLLPKM